MDYKVFLSSEAVNDLERIVGYIAPHNPVAAETMGNLLLDAALSLNSNSERGRVVPEFQDAKIRELIVQSYRIIYRVSHADKSVEILRFWHAARGFPHIPSA